eukprot:gene29340-38419_t
MFSTREADGPRVTFAEVKAIAEQPNYIQYRDSHYYLTENVLAEVERKRMSEALVDLSRNILSHILKHFSPDNKSSGNYSRRSKLPPQLKYKNAAEVVDLCKETMEPRNRNSRASTAISNSYNLRRKKIATRRSTIDEKMTPEKESPETPPPNQQSSASDEVMPSTLNNQSTVADENETELTVLDNNTISGLDSLPIIEELSLQLEEDTPMIPSTYSIDLDAPLSPCISPAYLNSKSKEAPKGGDVNYNYPYNLRRHINTRSILSSPPAKLLSSAQRRGARKALKQQRFSRKPNPNAAKNERNWDDSKDNKESDNIHHQQQAYYYSPQKVQQNLEMEQHNHNLPSQSTMEVDDFCKPHWNAIRSVDIAQVMGKFPTYTFKKVYRTGTQLGFIYDTITQKIVDYSSKSTQSNPEAFELYLKVWVLFSPLFLRISKSSSISIIKHRITQYKSLQWELMISDLLYDCKELSKPTRTQRRNSYKGVIPVGERSPESRYETAAKNFEDKDISKAYKTIVHPSTTSHVVSSESIRVLRDLHPQRKPGNEIPAVLLKAARETVVPPLSTPKTLWRIIRNLRNGTAPGMDGLRSEHLVSMARHGKAKWISSMSTIINLALASALPTWLNEIFAYSKLIGLVKQSDENGNLKLRPIGIGMVWPKIISKTILNYYRSSAKDYFEPHQFGLSQSGLESITHITKEALKEHPDWVLLRLDLVNAFNSIFRKIIFEEVYKHFPLLLPWLNCLYGDFSHLWTKSDQGEFYFPLSSEEGVKQGCTLGSFLFCLAIHHPVIKKINELLTSSLGDNSSSSTGFAFGLLDDINIIADPAVLTFDFWDKIREVLSSCGLSINMEKATLYTSTCSDESLSILRSELPQSLKFRSDGVELVGTPIGNDEFCKTYWETNLLNEMQNAIPLVCSWPDVQRALCLFRLCIVSKYNYFLRHSDPRSMYAAHISESIHQLVQNGLAHILDPLTTEEFQTIITEKIWLQSILPPKMGGLGIQDPLLTHLPAFIAAASVGTSSYLHLKNVIKAGYDKVPNCSGSTVDLFRPAHSDVHSALSENGTEELFNTFKDKHGIQDVTVNDLIVQPRLQTFLTSHMYSSINSAFRKTLTNQDLDRLNSCCYEGAVLITALPCHDDFCINGDHLFRERLLMRLGLPIPGVVSGKCLCKHGSNDIYGYHLLSVCNVGNQRINTHNAVRDSFREMCKAAGLSTRIEDMDTLKQNNIDTKSRVDIVCDNFLPGIPMAFDHSIADPRQSGLVAKAIPGKAAKKREFSKITKYKNDLARQGMRFGPFVLESYGRWGYRTRVYFKHLIAKIIENSKLHACSLDGSVITHYWRCKITLAMHRQACLGMHSRIHALQRHYQLKASLTKSNLSAKVIQNYPFQNNSTVLDDSYRLGSYVTSDSANGQPSNSSVIQYQENPLLKEPSTTDTIISPFLTLAARSISGKHNSGSPTSLFCSNNA